MLWCLTNRITGVPPNVSVALKIALRSLDHLYITTVVIVDNTATPSAVVGQ